MAQTLSADDVSMLDAMMSPLIPMTQKARDKEEDASKKEVAKMESDTQILLAIFEKVVCIEHMLEDGKASAGASAPAYSGNLSPQLES